MKRVTSKNQNVVIHLYDSKNDATEKLTKTLQTRGITHSNGAKPGLHRRGPRRVLATSKVLVELVVRHWKIFENTDEQTENRRPLSEADEYQNAPYANQMHRAATAETKSKIGQQNRWLATCDLNKGIYFRKKVTACKLDRMS